MITTQVVREVPIVATIPNKPSNKNCQGKYGNNSLKSRFGWFLYTMIKPKNRRGGKNKRTSDKYCRKLYLFVSFPMKPN